MKLAIDHHYPSTITDGLREHGHDVVTALERGWDRQDDEPLLALCTAEHRTLLTNNVADFAVIAQRWAAEGRQHAGLIFTSDSSLPRTRAMTGRYIELLEPLLRAHPGDRDFDDRMHWL